MSDCEKIRERLWDIAGLDDDEIPAQVKEHLAVCPECAAEFDEIKKIKAELPSLHEEAPDELLQKVMTAVKKEPRRSISINKIIKICAASAAAMLLCVFTAYNFMLSDQKNGDMMAPECEDNMVNTSTSIGAADDKSEAELPETTIGSMPEENNPSMDVYRFSELLDFDYSDCPYSGIFPDDVSVLYFVSENRADKIGLVLEDCFKDEIPDRTLYIGKSDGDKITELDEICEIKYTRTAFSTAEYFAVIVVKE